MKSNKSTHHPFYKYSTSTLFAVYQVHSWEVKAIMPIKTQENVGREDLCCFAIHDRSLLIPTDSMTILFKPKETHFWVPRLPPGYQSLSCLKVWHFWPHPSLAPMRRDTYSLFANSPVRNHHCLSPLALTILSQHFSWDAKLGRSHRTPLTGRWSNKKTTKCFTSHF